MITRSLALGIALPALIAGSVLWVAWRAWRRDVPVSASWSVAPAFGLAFVAGYAVVVGWPPFPPVEATQRLVYEVLAAVPVLAVLVWRPANVRFTSVVRAAFSCALPWLLLRPNIHYRWTTVEDIAWVGGLGTATFLYGLALDASTRRNLGVVAPLNGCIASSGLAIVAVLGHSALLGQLAGASTAALGATCVVGLMQPRLALAPAGTAILAWIWAGLSINVAFYAEGSPWALLIVAAASLGGFATRPLPATAGTWTRVLATGSVSALFAGAAVFVAWRA